MEFLKNIVAIISLIYFSIDHVRSAVDREYDVTERIPQSVRRRQDAIPVLYVNGSHYEVGFMIGQTFGKVIKDFLESYGPLREYLEIYETSDEGKQIYNECLEVTNKYFPQYLVEIKGMADGANVTFHELFLVHMDDILTSNVRRGTSSTDTAGGTGCTTLMVNIPCRAQFIGHTEDALNATVNHYYIVSAHIKPRPEEFGGLFAAREEKWEAVTYAGSLSGYASGHNYHGLVFTINTIFAKRLIRERIPRVFLTRALLACKADINEMKEILTNRGAGTADAFRVNAVFLVDTHGCCCPRRQQKFYSIEVTPSATQRMSNLYTETTVPRSTSFHVNRLHDESNCEELRESGWQSSVARQQRYAELTSKKSVKTMDDVLRILGDTTVRDEEWQIFRDRPDDFVNTINLGVFDCIEKTWTLWTNNPKTNPAVIKLPLKFNTFISPVTDRTVENKSPFNGIMSGVSSIYTYGMDMFNNLF